MQVLLLWPLQSILWDVAFQNRISHLKCEIFKFWIFIGQETKIVINDNKIEVISIEINLFIERV